MKGDPENDLLAWIKRLHHTCLALNEALIQSFHLEQEPLLEEYDRFELPTMAVKNRLIPRNGSIAAYNTQRPISYHVHGTGVTIFADAAKVWFEYYPKEGSRRNPILGLNHVYDFIQSINPLDVFCDYERLKTGLLVLFHEGALVRLDETYFMFYLAED